MIWIVLALIIFIAQVATILLLEFRRPSKLAAWLLILFLFPLIGFVMYYFLAQEYQHRRKLQARSGVQQAKERQEQLYQKVSAARARQPEQMSGGQFVHQERLFGLLASLPHAPITGNNATHVLTDATEMFPALLKAIASARHHIHLEFYTIRADGIGQQLQQALISKAHEGVEIRIIYDGVGSLGLSKTYVQELQAAGIETQCFLPPRFAFFDKRVNYRDHRKIAVVDGLIGFVGGINIGDEYLGANPKLGYWRDTHLQVEGDAVYFLQEAFMQSWLFTANILLTGDHYWPAHACNREEQVQIVVSGPDMEADAIQKTIFAAVAAAKCRIYITTPYFIPDPGVLLGLKTAALSGVDVRIIVPCVADSRLVLNASLSYVDELLSCGVHFYRYRKGFVHAKVLIVDKLLASVGTANMDMRSFFSNFECNALLYSSKAIERLAQDFYHDLEECEAIVQDVFRQRSRRRKAGELFSRLLSPLL